jgi:hypothetical protein
LPTLERETIARTSLSGRGALIRVQNRDEALALINRIAPEHLELSVENPEELLPSIRHAGAIFMGRFTPEALGDYCAGPNHVLPTSGTARFSSPLGVYDFQKRSSLIYCSAAGASELAKVASVLARGEGLTAHARSAEYRIQSSDRSNTVMTTCRLTLWPLPRPATSSVWQLSGQSACFQGWIMEITDDSLCWSAPVPERVRPGPLGEAGGYGS